MTLGRPLRCFLSFEGVRVLATEQTVHGHIYEYFILFIIIYTHRIEFSFSRIQFRFSSFFIFLTSSLTSSRPCVSFRWLKTKISRNRFASRFRATTLGLEALEALESGPRVANSTSNRSHLKINDSRRVNLASSLQKLTLRIGNYRVRRFPKAT